MVSRRRMRVQWLGCMPGGKAIVLTQVHGILALSAAAARGGGERGIKPLLQLQNPFSALAGCVDYEAIINTCPRQHTNTQTAAGGLTGWRAGGLGNLCPHQMYDEQLSSLLPLYFLFPFLLKHRVMTSKQVTEQNY